jgi:hypothetical protein
MWPFWPASLAASGASDPRQAEIKTDAVDVAGADAGAGQNEQTRMPKLAGDFGVCLVVPFGPPSASEVPVPQ